MKAVSFTFIAYVLCLFFIGVGYIAITPPFEPFDESAHYAAIRQVADTRTLPLRGQSFLPRDIANYQGPVAYGTLHPPFDRGLVPTKFFSDPSRVTRYKELYRAPTRRLFVPSHTPNWQAQHPPLYYIVMAPLLKLTHGFSFVGEILVLRLVSLVMALAGVILAHRAVRGNGLHAGFAVYPLLLPMFFPAFARVGNDSLCLLLAGVLAVCLARSFEAPQEIRWPIGGGVALGLGLATKALFLPIAAAVFVFLIYRAVRCEQSPRPVLFRHLIAMAVPALALGAPWYVHHYLHFGVWSGGNEALRLAQAGGLAAAMKTGFAAGEVLRGVVVAVVTWIWAGSWSLARLHPLLYLPPIVLLAGVLAAFIAAIRKRPLTDPAWLCVLLLGVFGAGLLWHMVISVALDGTAATMGTYLHLLLPWVAPAFGIGVAWTIRGARHAAVMRALLVYAVVFHVIALWCQFALFTGCAWKGADKSYAFPGHSYCLDQVPLLVTRLGVIGWPWLALAGFTAGIICAAWIAARRPLSGTP
jgi:hypothetical protein